MYFKWADSLAVTQGTDFLSPAYPLGASDNAARAGVTIVNYAGTGVTTSMEGSMDAQQWSALATTLAQTAVGWNTFANTAISFRFIRFRVAVAGAGVTVIIRGDCYSSQQ